MPGEKIRPSGKSSRASGEPIRAPGRRRRPSGGRCRPPADVAPPRGRLSRPLSRAARRLSRAGRCPYDPPPCPGAVDSLGRALSGETKTDYKKQLAPLAAQRVVFIFDECHRSQFGENHQAIKEFFPNAQLFGFTGTPIFEVNSSAKQITGDVKQLRTTEDLFQNQLHAYTITDAIEDRNVLKFQVDYFAPTGPDGKPAPIKPGEALAKQAVVDAILAKHDTATGGRRFNAILATGSINDAIEYHNLFKAATATASPGTVPLNVTAVFSPPAQLLAKEGDAQSQKTAADVRQLQEGLVQENEDNQHNPEEKMKALEAIIADYNEKFGTNHRIEEFDLYYQDVQKRIKDQQYPNADLPKKGREKIDITIVVDMLLTGFDSKYLNTLYVDKNLKHHALIQAFSRTNRVLNDTKPYGHILDFRNQQENVDAAIALFSGVSTEQARKIWLVDKAPVVIEKLQEAKTALDTFLKSQGTTGQPQDVANLKGTAAKAAFVKHFKEVQRLQTQLDQYTDLTPEQEEAIETILPKPQLQAFRGQYLETAEKLKADAAKPGAKIDPVVEQLDFEFVLFASPP